MNSPTYKIAINDLSLTAFVGVYEQEKQFAQSISINLAFQYRSPQLAQSDRIEDALDYAKLAERIKQLVGSRHFNLIETLAAAILEDIRQIPEVIGAEVEVLKPQAIQNATSVSVKLNWP